MSESLIPLAMACSLFVLGHVLISSTPLRMIMVRRIGEGPYMGLFSLAVTAPLVWMITAFGEAPREILWEGGPALSALPLVTMPFAMIFLVASLWGS